MDNCIFCKIVAGEIPSAKVYEDDKMLVFKDIEPKAKVHLLCVPKEHFAFLSEADEKRVALIGSMLQTVGAHYKEWGLQEGYRVVINQGENAFCRKIGSFYQKRTFYNKATPSVAFGDSSLREGAEGSNACSFLKRGSGPAKGADGA